jgi:alkanesulfonate monooxygenase SsuD/methylene tetrahydromethanopterin reductase-like flavin-dependent oxidoreductase (luciferase family)
MEFSLFAHMERTSPDLPQERLYEEFIDLCKMADEGGMRAIWTGEHHGMDFTIAPNPFLSLVDLAHHTKKVRLGTGTVVAPFWHPIKLAGEAASADLMTGGRIELGIARGAYSYEYERLMPGLDAWQAGQRMRETAPFCARFGRGIARMRGNSTPSRPQALRPSRCSRMARLSGSPRVIQTAMNSASITASTSRSRRSGRAWRKSRR